MIFTHLLDKLNYAPVDKMETVMDVASGTGAWAIEFGNHVLFLFVENTTNV
jgi:ubiquinone/menaquinone biosynthesis C-methylase UbiE